jgi:DNA polymerase III subunit epsilon
VGTHRWSVLRHSLDDYQIQYPELDYYCTRVISRAIWTTLPRYGLELVSHYLGLPFIHHAVEEDALACATIVLHGCSEVDGPDLIQLAKHLAIRCRHLSPV